MRHSLLLKSTIILVPLTLILWYTTITLRAPKHQEHLCQLFQEHPSWYWSAQRAEQKWGVPISVQMAIIHQESHFRAGVKPPHHLWLGFIPGFRPTTAEGYAQVVDGTWQEYLHSTHQRSARRSSFANAVDFIGWYSNQLHHQLGIAKSDAESMYLAYYLGPGGYRSGRYQNNPRLIAIAHKVAKQQQIYQSALNRCQATLSQRPWWHVW